MSKQIWMGHAGHFICGRNCGFRLNTYVNGYIVSTVGELKYSHDKDSDGFRKLGAAPDSLYETMVFRATKTGHACCPYAQESGSELATARYATADEAAKGHAKMLARWSRKKAGGSV